MDATIAIPVFNEEAILVSNTQRLCDYLDGRGSFEVLLLCNGCTDSSLSLGRRLESSRLPVRVFSLAQRDVAGAFRLALSEAQGDLLISMDMDLSADLSFIQTALDKRADFEMLVGSKKLGSENRSLIRRTGSDLYVACASKLMGVADYSMGAKAYQTQFFRPLATELGDGTPYVVECIYLTRLQQGRIIEIPIRCQDHRASRFNLASEAANKFLHLAGLFLRHRSRSIQWARLHERSGIDPVAGVEASPGSRSDQ